MYYCFLANRVCGNDFTQHIPLRKPRRSQNKPKPIPDYLPIKILTRCTYIFNQDDSQE